MVLKPIDKTGPSRRGNGDGTRERRRTEHERPVGVEGVGLHRRMVGPRRESEGHVVPRKPVKTGGGKEPWFWCAFRRRRDSGIGAILRTPRRIGSFRGSSTGRPRAARRGTLDYDSPYHGDPSRSARTPSVNPVREPGAANSHAGFDERGRETELWSASSGTLDPKGEKQSGPPVPTATAPFLDSTPGSPRCPKAFSTASRKKRSKTLSRICSRAGIPRAPCFGDPYGVLALQRRFGCPRSGREQPQAPASSREPSKATASCHTSIRCQPQRNAQL